MQKPNLYDDLANCLEIMQEYDLLKMARDLSHGGCGEVLVEFVEAAQRVVETFVDKS